MPYYAANCPISRPLPVGVLPHADFNGLQFNYNIGMMYPPQAALQFSFRLPVTKSP